MPTTTSSKAPAPHAPCSVPETLLYAITPCSLGLMLMATSTHGVCALLFADDEPSLLADVEARFPSARLHRDQPGLQSRLDAILNYLQAPTHRPDLPLDLRGSTFQQRVWRALLDIPCGQTVRYSELAARLGSHARAVAGACARNPIGLLVPCHRVTGANQSLTGYRWGLARKAALLASERQAVDA